MSKKKTPPKEYGVLEFLTKQQKESVLEIGKDVIMGVIEGGLPGMIILAVPLKDGSKEIMVFRYENIQTAIKGALEAVISDKAKLKKIMRAYKAKE